MPMLRMACSTSSIQVDCNTYSRAKPRHPLNAWPPGMRTRSAPILAKKPGKNDNHVIPYSSATAAKVRYRNHDPTDLHGMQRIASYYNIQRRAHYTRTHCI